MLIGDKGQSGGRRWGGVRICYHNIFVQSQGQSQGVAFWGEPILQQVILGSDAGCCILLIQGFAAGHSLESHKELTMFNQRILSLDHPY